MHVLVISDIHANLPALDSVLEDARAGSRSYQAVWCLGDLVGYGPDPNECVERVRQLPNLVCLNGNHDQAALGLIPLSRFNQDARAAASWTGQVLTDANRSFLASLSSRLDQELFTLAHGSPRQPVWEYILDTTTADRNFEAFTSDY
ncbi:MAG: metallophosphoesterase family protein, partial [Anaerolineales bacterium]